MSTKGITEADRKANAKAYYTEIFNTPHWEPISTDRRGLLSHPRMPMDKRAAIFASFDALVGFKETVTETARRTDGRIELAEGELEELSRRLETIIDRMEEGTDNGEMSSEIIRADEEAAPTVSITYFVPDELKSGGEYRTVTGAVRKIDLYQRIMVLEDGKTVKIDEIVKFDGEIFGESE